MKKKEVIGVKSEENGREKKRNPGGKKINQEENKRKSRGKKKNQNEIKRNHV